MQLNNIDLFQNRGDLGLDDIGGIDMTSHGLRLMGDKRLEANCSRIERSLLAVEQEIMQKTRKGGWSTWSSRLLGSGNFGEGAE